MRLARFIQGFGDTLPYDSVAVGACLRASVEGEVCDRMILRVRVAWTCRGKRPRIISTQDQP